LLAVPYTRFLQSRRRTLTVVAVAALATVAGPAASAMAAGPTFALKPATEATLGYFVLAGKPGATLRGKVEVINVGTKAGKTSLYAVDATTGETSGAVYRSKQEPRRDVGDWVKLGKGTLELGPGESTVVPFTVRVPDEAAAGQHLGGIVAQRPSAVVGSKAASGGKEKNGFSVKIQALSVLAVQVNVPGPERPRMTLSGITPGDQPGHQSLLLGIGNTGNVLVKGTGTLKVVNHSGRQEQSQSFNLDTFVPESQIDFPVYIQGKALSPGRYRGTVTIDYRGRSLARTYPFTITSTQVAQVFGTQASHGSPIGSSNDNTLLYVLIVVTVLSLSAALFFFWRNRRLA
jgi:hypothetical protein